MLVVDPATRQDEQLVLLILPLWHLVVLVIYNNPSMGNVSCPSCEVIDQDPYGINMIKSSLRYTMITQR